MDIAVLGLNHNTAPVCLREQLAFDSARVPQAIRAVREEVGISECVILSTCNRVELYTVLSDRNGTEGRLRVFLSRFHRLKPEAVEPCLYWHRQPDSVRHLFHVAAGLDSMVVGESEILGQVREAYTQAVAHGSVGSVFHRLFQTALRVGKQVRSKTRIGRGPTSVPSVAVELARRIFQRLARKRVLVIGAGQMAQITLDCLRRQGVDQIVVANRSPERAQALVGLGGEASLALDQLEGALVHSDIVISSAAADHFLLTQERVRRAMMLRRQRALFFIDIAVPRSMEPRIGELENVYLYNIDDLQGMASTNQQMRLEEVQACSQIVERELDGFLTRLNGSGTLR